MVLRHRGWRGGRGGGGRGGGGGGGGVGGGGRGWEREGVYWGVLSVECCWKCCRLRVVRVLYVEDVGSVVW